MFSHLSLAAVAAVLPLFSSLVTAQAQVPFNPAANTNVGVYWGQGGGQQRLSYYCRSTSTDIIAIAFVNVFPGQGVDGYPGSNFGNACGTSYTLANGTQTTFLTNCTQIAQDIPYCQGLGKKILVSLGGATPSTQSLANDGAGQSFATFLWGAFGPQTASYTGPRPFGTAVIDGFDFDIEHNGPTGYVAMINQLRTLFAADKTKTYYISGSPQCVIPDANLGPVISGTAFDFVFIQFYNTAGCSAMDYINNSGHFNFDNWVTTVQGGASKNAKLYIGLPGDASSASPGFYLNPTQMSTLVNSVKAQFPSQLGGVMIWQASTADMNRNAQGNTFTDACKAVLLGLGANSTSTTTTTTATTSKPTTSSTSTTSKPTTSTTSTTSKPTTTTTSSTPTTSKPTTTTTSTTPTTSMTFPSTSSLANTAQTSTTTTSTGAVVFGNTTTTKPSTSVTPSSLSPTGGTTPTTTSRTTTPTTSPTTSRTTTSTTSATPVRQIISVPTTTSTTSTSSDPPSTSTTSSPNVSVNGQTTPPTSYTTPTTSVNPVSTSTTTSSSSSSTTSEIVILTTVITTNYVDICPTGFTTKTTAYSHTYPSNSVYVSPTSLPTNFVTTTVTCTQCAGPDTVTLTVPCSTTTAAPAAVVTSTTSPVYAAVPTTSPIVAPVAPAAPPAQGTPTTQLVTQTIVPLATVPPPAPQAPANNYVAPVNPVAAPAAGSSVPYAAAPSAAAVAAPSVYNNAAPAPVPAGAPAAAGTSPYATPAALSSGFATAPSPVQLNGVPTAGAAGSYPSYVPSGGSSLPTSVGSGGYNVSSTGSTPTPYLSAGVVGRDVSFVGMLIAVIAGAALL